MTCEHRSELIAKIGFLAVLTLLIVFAGHNNSQTTATTSPPSSTYENK